MKFAKMAAMTMAATIAAGQDGPAIRECDWAALNAAAREEAKVPVRLGEPGVRPFWNSHSKAFIHPPAFDFADVDGVKEWRFEIDCNREQSTAIEEPLAVWTAPHPWLPVPGDIWDSLPPGYYTLNVETASQGGVRGEDSPRPFPLPPHRGFGGAAPVLSPAQGYALRSNLRKASLLEIASSNLPAWTSER